MANKKSHYTIERYDIRPGEYFQINEGVEKVIHVESIDDDTTKLRYYILRRVA
jgi:hypothetical protein